MKCVLFDLDGTIADTEILKAEALSRAVAKFGGQVAAEQYKLVMGQSWERVTEEFFRQAGISVLLDQFNPIFREEYAKLIDSELKPKAGVREFLHHLREQKVAIALVSSASPWMIQKVLTKLDLTEMFDVVVSGADTKKHKPDPEAYVMALAKLNCPASEAIAFEDSASGIEAAVAAGVLVYGVRHGFNESHSFAGSMKIISSFENWLNLLPQRK